MGIALDIRQHPTTSKQRLPTDMTATVKLCSRVGVTLSCSTALYVVNHRNSIQTQANAITK